MYIRCFMVILLESHPHSPFFSGWMFSRGGGGDTSICMYIGYVPRERPPFSTLDSVQEHIIFTNYPPKNPFRSITILLSFPLFFFFFFFFWGGGGFCGFLKEGDQVVIVVLCLQSALGVGWGLYDAFCFLHYIYANDCIGLDICYPNFMKKGGWSYIRIFPLPAIGTALSSARIMSVVDKFRISSDWVPSG